MEYRLFVSAKAKEEIADAIDWYNKIGGNQSERFLNELDSFFEKIRAKPKIYRKRAKNLRIANLKVFRYQVIYRINSDSIEVVAVFHSKRNPKIWRKR